MSNRVPSPDETLGEVLEVRVFPGTTKEILKYARRDPDRWPNESSFVRSALMSFFRKLDAERMKR